MARILRHKIREVHRETSPTPPDVDDCWIPDVEDAVKESGAGFDVVLERGLRGAGEVCVWAQEWPKKLLSPWLCLDSKIVSLWNPSFNMHAQTHSWMLIR